MKYKLLIVALLLIRTLHAQAIPDSEFKYRVPKPAWSKGSGPVVMIDQAHFNHHTATGRYLPFAELLRSDGYKVQSSETAFDKPTLKRGDIMVIANALHKSNDHNWDPPNPSAFTDDEIAALRDWVNEGGALLLIADHLPWPAAANKLASAFGIHYSPGHALDEKTQADPMIFSRSNGTMAKHPITEGRSASERVDSIATFTGSAFRVDKGGEPLLIFGPGIVSFTPTNSWTFNADTPRIPVAGWYQGAVLHVGKGRLAVFGEAAMFSAQVYGPSMRRATR